MRYRLRHPLTLVFLWRTRWVYARLARRVVRDSAIHIAGSAAVLLVLLVPALDRRLRAGLSGTGRPRKR